MKRPTFRNDNMVAAYAMWVAATEAWIGARWGSGADPEEEMRMCWNEALFRFSNAVNKHYGLSS